MQETDNLSIIEMKYPDRASAAIELLASFELKKISPDMILAIPRGGVITGKVLAEQLGRPLDLLLCKKIGHPENSEYAIGSVCADGTRIQTDTTSDYHRDYFQRQCLQMETWLLARYKTLTGRDKPADLRGKSVMIVDDGLATGSTMLAAIRSVRTGGASHVAVATPVASTEAATAIQRSADEFHCPMVSAQFGAVGEFYERFETVNDDEVRKVMSHSLKV